MRVWDEWPEYFRGWEAVVRGLTADPASEVVSESAKNVSLSRSRPATCTRDHHNGKRHRGVARFSLTDRPRDGLTREP
jgi:hypothetical protein